VSLPDGWRISPPAENCCIIAVALVSLLFAMTPILAPDVVEFVSGSPAQTARIGERLGELLQPGDVICLAGPLGAGKTCLAQGVGKGWGASGDVTSPTFTLVHELRRARDDAVLYHIDLYRIESSDEARLLGLGDLCDGRATCLIEWPERAGAIAPAACLSVRLAWIDDTRRRLTFGAEGDRHLRLLSELKRAAFGAGS
jgi:tRNA threonylcarbamoyladenosine biosynthesis protein TsaE